MGSLRRHILNKPFFFVGIVFQSHKTEALKTTGVVGYWTLGTQIRAKFCTRFALTDEDWMGWPRIEGTWKQETLVDIEKGIGLLLEGHRPHKVSEEQR